MLNNTKICKVCVIEKNIDQFHKKLNGLAPLCKSCTSEVNKAYREAHREELNAYRRKYYVENKENLIQYAVDWRTDPENKKYVSEYKKKYFLNNRDSINEQHNKRRKIRRQEDPAYRLRNLVSRSVSRMLKENNSSKKGGSIKDNLPFSIENLKSHLEKLFEPWMNWQNQNKYDPKTWDDNNSLTWTWHLDHIVPQSDLPYTSMEDDNFQKCWSLDNLRPLSSKININDGAQRTRHQIKIKEDS